MATGSDIVATARSYAGRFYYTNNWWERMNPLESGGTDCSGFCRFVYGLYGYDIGTWTGDESCAGREIARGHYPSEIPWDILNPGDLIFMTATYWNNYDFDQYLCHVEIYCGDGTMIGHPGGMGPQEKWAQAWMEAYGCITWMVRRVFESEDDMNKEELISTRDSGNIPAWEAWSWAFTYAKDAASALDKEIATSDSGNIPVWQAISWSYTYAKEAAAQIAALTEAVKVLAESKGADPKAIEESIKRAVSEKLDNLTFKAQ